MLTTRVLDAAACAAEGWADALLALDRENMAAVIERAGVEYPEARRLAGLRNPSLVLILLLDGPALAGYVEFCEDLKHERGIHIGSLQIGGRYRRGRALAILLVEAARALRGREFDKLRAGVYKNNDAAVRLYRRLGFQLHARPDTDASWRIVGPRELLDSELLRRLATGIEGRYERAD